MIYTLFNPTTGQITGRTGSPENYKMWASIAGSYDSNTYYIKDGQAREYPRPPGSREMYRWNNTTETWEIDLHRAAVIQRRTRDQLLSAVDRVNPLWFNSLTAEQQAELQQYRLALLAVPDQPGFPATVTWPAKPRWL